MNELDLNMHGSQLAELKEESRDIEPVVNKEPQRFVFTGRGGEYFRIWIVNLLLTILTLGIYSAFAKVRKLKYLYHNTQVAGSSFEYHGNPIAILKGRAIALILIIAQQVTYKFYPLLGYILFGVTLIATPWLLWRSLQFKLYNSSYRGIRFGFRGSWGQAALVYLVYPFLAALSLYLLAPFAHQRMKRFQHAESRFGNTYFSFQGKVSGFYKAYAIAILLALLGGIIIILAVAGLYFGILKNKDINSYKDVVGAVGFSSLLVVLILLMLWFSTLRHIFMTMIQRLIWNTTLLSHHRFKNDMKWGKELWIGLTNMVGIVLTLGLFTPFAQMRSMKYRIESMLLIPGGSLDHFIADTEHPVSATGEGVADLLDFDIAL